jgi:hypothetical protein
MVAQVRYSVARRSRGRVTPCAVCTWHMKTRSTGFLVEPQNQGRRFVSGLASKPLERFSPVCPQNRWRRFLAVWPQNLQRRFSLVWPQNQWRQFSPVWPQNWWLWFSDLGLKIYAMVSWFVPQNLTGFSLSVAPQNRRREVNAGHVSRSSSLLGVEASLARVF